MDLTPHLLTDDVEFREVRRGYDPGEVDDFLERVGTAVATLQQQLAEANRRAEAAEAKAAEATAGGAAVAEGADEIQRTLVLAQRTADAAVKEARHEADRLVADARAEAEGLVAGARAEAVRESEAARAGQQAEAQQLAAVRDGLRGDIAILEQHLEAQRSKVRAALSDLQHLVDDPERFRVEPATGLSEPVIPTPVAPAPAPAAAPSTPVASAPSSAAPMTQAEPAAPASPAPAPSTAPEASYSPVLTLGAEEPAPVVTEVATAPPAVDELIDLAEPGPAVIIDAQPAIDEVDPGPPTQAIDAVGAAPDDEDEFLAELRKAMTDDEPLGPREADGDASDADDRRGARSRPRFGRRR